MSFQNPAILWALPLVLIPLILHLFSIQNKERLLWSSLLLWRRIRERLLPRSRLLEWLLLLIRCGIILCLILGFSRPTLKSNTSFPSWSPHHKAEGIQAVLLLDASYSMGYRSHGKTRFELAKKAAEDLFRLFKPNDRIALGVFSNRWESPPLEWTSDLERLRRQLKTLVPTSRTTNYKNALQQAYRFLSENEQSQEKKSSPPKNRKAIFLLTDGMLHGLQGEDPKSFLKTIPGYDPEVVLLGLQWEEESPNAFIESSSPEQTFPLKIKTKIRLHGPPRSDWEANLSEWQENQKIRTLQNTRIDLKTYAGQSQELSWPPIAPSDSEWFAGDIQLQNDNLPADDVFSVAFYHKNKPRILCLYADPLFMTPGKTGFFLKNMSLEPNSNAAPFLIDFFEWGRLREFSLSQYQAVILAHLKKISPEESSWLKPFLQRGGGLWIIPSEGMEPEPFLGLAPWLPGQLGNIKNAAESGGARLVLKNAPNPTPWKFRWEDFTWDKIRLQKYYEIRSPRDAVIWFSTPGGDPLLLQTIPPSKILLSAFSLDWNRTNLGLKPAFIPLLHLVLSTLTDVSEPETFQADVDNPIHWSWKDRSETPSPAWVLTPDGKKIKPIQEGSTIKFLETSRPGLYTLEYENKDTSGDLIPGISEKRFSFTQKKYFAVNLDRQSGEGNLTAISSPPWKNLRSDKIQEDFNRIFFGFEMNGIFMAGVVFLLIAETFLLARRKL